MKQKITLALALLITSYCSNAQNNKCTITCNVTTAYVCPNSNTWKSNPGIYNDASFMKDLGYTKDNSGCWRLGNNNTTVTLKTDDKKKAQSWWDKVKNYFSGAKKTGF